MRLRMARLLAGFSVLFAAALMHISAGAAEAALQYVGGTTGSGTAATYNVNLSGTLTGGIASSPAAGDIVIVVTGWASTVDGNPGVTTAGYTEVYDGWQTDTRGANMSVSYKIMSASPDTSVTVSGFNNAANGGATAVHVWRGVDQATPMDVAAPSAPLGVFAANAARPNSPAITPVTTGAVVIAVGLGTGVASPTAMTAPTGFINGLSALGAGSTMGAVANIASQEWAGGAVDPAAWTGGGSTTSDSWVAGTLALRPAVGPNSTITDCIGCHGYGSDGRTYTFNDGTARNVPAGQFVGDHAKHDYVCTTCHTDAGVDLAHRNANIDMAAAISGGTYSRGTSFPQSNSPTPGTCSAVTCHGGLPTPQWGVGATTCSSCHALPPNTNAHTKHYTAKGWATGVATNCTVCHPDNTAGHSNVTDNNPEIIAGLSMVGLSCNVTGTGCHNGQPTPDWNLTATCTSCHTVGGSNSATVANPVSGLHNMGTGGVQKHDNTISANACEECHVKVSISGHWNGTASATADYTAASVGISFASGSYTDAGGTGASRGTCTSTCHQDNGAWARQWSTAADSAVTTAGDARCAVCHGQFGDWRTGTSHAGTNGGAASTRGSSHNSLTGASNACEDCHSYPTQIANHQNGLVTVNQTGGTWVVTRASGSTYCSNCHTNDGLPSAAGTHTFVSSALTLQPVAGANDPVGDCGGCHGGGTVSGTNKNFWPDDIRAHTANQSGRHVKHMTVIARRLYNEDLTTLLVDNGNGTSAAKQKAICEYCHAATTNDSDHPNTYPADVFSTSLGQKAKHLTGAADADAAYSAAADTCSNIDCHASKLTTDGTFGWYDAGASTCTMCHTVGDATNNPNSGLHMATAPTVSGAAGQHDDAFGTGGTCTTCHSALTSLTTTQANTHINNVFNGDTVANLGLNTTINYVQSTPNVGTCFGSGNGALSTCHNGAGDMGSWKRVWNSAVNNGSGGAECAGCHGGFNNDWTFGTVANTTDGSVEHNRNWDTPQDAVAEVIGNHSNNTANTNKCNTCHVYGDPQYILTGGGKHHMDGNITMNSVPSYNSTNRNCTNSCHSDNTGHAMEASGWTTGSLAGPPMSCTTCHGGGNPAAGVSATSSHVDADGGGGTFTSGNCEDCHLAHADGTTGTNDVEISTVYTGTTAVPTMTKADGTTALYSLHSYKIRLGGNATVGKTVSGLSVTFTAPNQINGTGIGSGTFPAAFRIGDIIQVKGSTSNGTTAVPKYFTVTQVTANQLLVAEAITSEAASTTEIISSSATEAQLCWNCHTGIGGAGTFGISEWGADTGSNNVDTGSGTYDYGTLFTDASTVPGTKTANWTSGVWRSAKGLNSTLTSNPYWYKRGSVRSTHSANYDGTTATAGSDGTNWKAGLLNNTGGYTTTYNKNETKDDVVNIRCTYCHDVHGTHDGIKGDAATAGGGQPYLRGTWLSNPYPEDGAPRFGMANFTVQSMSGGNTLYGVVPRASASSTNTGITAVANVGGWWIDQNSNNPVAGHTNTAFRTATGNAGLCEQCHGSDKNGTWTAAEIGAIDQITGEGLWVSSFNGHANSVVGGSMTETGTNLQWNNTTKLGRNIFNRTVRGSNSLSRTAPSAAVDMGLATHPPTTSRGYSYRSSTSDPGYEWRPHTSNSTIAGTTSARSTAFMTFAWNTTISSSSTRNSTIASGTAQLTFDTNTTEAAHNAQANFHTFSCSKCHNPHASRLPKLMITNCLDTNHNTWEDNSTFVQDTTNHTLTALPSPWNGLRHSQWASAQNCHRLDARATGATSTVTMGVGWNKATPWIEDTSPNATKTSDLTTLPSY